MDVDSFLADDSSATFASWKKTGISKPLGPRVTEKESEKDARRRYLLEKYIRMWKSRMARKASPPSEIPEAGWLRYVLFAPSCRAARVMACSIVESLCQVRICHSVSLCYKDVETCWRAARNK